MRRVLANIWGDALPEGMIGDAALREAAGSDAIVDAIAASRRIAAGEGDDVREAIAIASRIAAAVGGTANIADAWYDYSETRCFHVLARDVSLVDPACLEDGADGAAVWGDRVGFPCPRALRDDVLHALARRAAHDMVAAAEGTPER